ncbi:T9SS type A sorting domain-containing protein [Hymenobacter sp. BT635]|uniref:T9SS type A sorting domain-containing protein n=1 Tax=Hymenobacter nitidus TaxID=2880929 RepID=A0ABS8A8D6_9BACT|nr:CARDB domain-containing protein [Hymenobacter nitidus]MCB2376162.1 T9SS type A sorting domain-containing protein [Hymenobacter nitidus]
MKHNYAYRASKSTTKPWWGIMAALLLLLTGQVSAQTYTVPVTGTTAVTTCAGTLYDNGGTGNYSANANGTITITPATAGSKVRLQFSSFAVGYYDRLTIYDGSSTSAPVIGTYYDYYSPGTVYATTSTGTLTLRFATDYYTSGYSGFAADISCVTTIPQPDLTIQGASVTPVSAVPGSSISLYSTIYNLSGTTASSSSVGYYLSTDANLDAADVLLGSSTGSQIAVGGYSSRNNYALLPANTTPGAYYILFAADHLNVVGESNESNNVASVYLNVVPPTVDLIIQQPSATPTTTAPGNVLSLACSITNQGNATAAYSSVGFYLSTNTTLDTNDQLLTSAYGGQLTSNYPSYRNVTTNVPPGTTPGTYYILFAADYQNVVSESNEQNNVASATITVAAPSVDLLINQASLSTYTMSAGTTINANGYTYNQGNITSPSSNVGYYFSTDATLSSNDVLLSSTIGGALAASQGNYPSSAITIPASATPGTRYILFVADYLNAVTESNETNNVRSVAINVITPSIDLVIQSAYLSTNTTTAGSLISANHYIVNQGNTVASSSNVGYYLSTDITLSSNDVLLTSTAGGALQGNDYSSRYPNLTIPAGTASGSYYVLFAADHLNQVAETNENNNVAYASLTLQAPGFDLVIQSAYLNNFTVAAGSSVNSSYTIINQGNTTVSSSDAGYYLSTNNTFGAGDVLLSSVAGGALGAGGYISRYPALAIPAGTASGSYYVLFVADHLNQVAETNETNNVYAIGLTVVQPGIDLTVSQAALSRTVMPAGTALGMGANINNLGTTSAATSNMGFYLSTDNTYSTGDVLLGSVNGSTLFAGDYSYRSGTFTVPSATTAGAYYVLFVADHQGQVTETNETNNVAALAITISAPFNGVLVPQTGSTSVTTCGTTVTDNGGNGDYADYSNGSLTINPGIAGNKVRLTFSSFSVESCCDALTIYDGANTNAPIIGTYTSLPGTITAQNASGALTLVFTSDGSVVSTGFEAAVTCVSVVALQPDLIVQAPSQSATTVISGNTITVGGTVANQGAGEASSSQLGYFLSTNTTLDSNDLLLGTSSGGTLAASASVRRTGVFSIPTNVTPGTYYLLYAADPAALVTESNETNNTTTLTVTIVAAQADLSVSQMAANPTSAPVGGTISASCLLTNTGTLAANASSMGFYLSADNVFSANDVLLGSVATAAMPINTGMTRAASFAIPTTTIPGSYYILYVADAQNAVAESNEQNNVGSLAFMVTVNTPVKEQLNGLTVSIYPNPATGGEFSVRLDGASTGKVAQLALYNSIGQQVSLQSLALTSGRGPARILTTGLGSGVYMLRITGDDLNVTRRIVIE